MPDNPLVAKLWGKSINQLINLSFRAYWRWNHKYVLPKRAKLTPVFQVIKGYGSNYVIIKKHVI